MPICLTSSDGTAIHFDVTPQDRASHLLGLGFDAAVLEIWAHLCAGATLCLADDAVRSIAGVDPAMDGPRARDDCASFPRSSARA